MYFKRDTIFHITYTDKGDKKIKKLVLDSLKRIVYSSEKVGTQPKSSIRTQYSTVNNDSLIISNFESSGARFIQRFYDKKNGQYQKVYETDSFNPNIFAVTNWKFSKRKEFMYTDRYEVNDLDTTLYETSYSIKNFNKRDDLISEIYYNEEEITNIRTYSYPYNKDSNVIISKLDSINNGKLLLPFK